MEPKPVPDENSRNVEEKDKTRNIKQINTNIIKQNAKKYLNC